MQEKYSEQYIINLLTLGNSSVGKTSLLNRYDKGIFIDKTDPTLGADFLSKNIKFNKEDLKIRIFDTAGQERFKSMLMTYYKKGDGILLVYDITDLNSFQDVQNFWLKEIKKHCHQNVKILLVGNKVDLDDDRKVLKSQGEQLADKMKIPFIETSTKTNNNIGKAFLQIINDVYQSKQSENNNNDQKGGVQNIQLQNNKENNTNNQQQQPRCC